MNSPKRVFPGRFARVVIGCVLVVAALGFAGTLWPASTRNTAPSHRGRIATLAELERVLDAPGPIVVESVVAADWAVDRSGVLDLHDLRAASLSEGPEPIQIYLHALHHPTAGLFVIDTGIERALTNDPEHAAVRGLVASAGHIDQMRVAVDTEQWVAQQEVPIAAIFLTHLHLDHVAGTQGFAAETPIVLGEGETTARSIFNLLTQPSIDRALEGHPLETWSFGSSARGEGVIDVLGDGSLWALEMPGHTRGSIAYVARTPHGPVLFTGDVCHTAWGWEHDVAPGTYTEDAEANRQSLSRLRALAARHPSLRVRLGHQALDAD